MTIYEGIYFAKQRSFLGGTGVSWLGFELGTQSKQVMLPLSYTWRSQRQCQLVQGRGQT